MDRIKIKNYLTEHTNVALDIAKECECWDCRFNNKYDIWDLAELVECFCADYESTKKFLNVLLNSLDTLPRDTDTCVRFSQYGDYIEEASEETLQADIIDDMDELLDAIEELYPAHIDIYDDKLVDLLTEEQDEN